MTKPSQIWGNIWQIIATCEKLISDYEIIQQDIVLQKRLPSVENVYIDSIIIQAAKIFSKSRNDAFRLDEFRRICRPEISVKLKQIEDGNKDIIGKIITNRNKLIAHLDKKFFELSFSDQEIERMTKDLMNGFRMSESEARDVYASMPRSADKSNERYSIQDFRNDFPVIKQMFEEIHNIWKISLPLKKL